MRFSFATPYVALLMLSVIGAAATACTATDASNSPPDNDGLSGTDGGGDSGPSAPGADGGSDPNAPEGGGPGAPDAGPPKAPAEPGIAYIQRSSYGTGIKFFDPVAGKSIGLGGVNYDGELDRPLRGGRTFAYLKNIANVPTLFRGYAGKNGVATAAFPLTLKSVSSPTPSASIDADGALYYGGEIAERGFVDFFREGVRISQSVGRTKLPASDGSLRLIDGVAGATAWCTGTGTKAKLVVKWPGQASEELLEKSDYVFIGPGDATFSPSGRCFAFPAELGAPSPVKGLGVRCKGEPTGVPTANGAPIAYASSSVVWHPTLDRLAAIDYASDNTALYVANKSGTSWSALRVSLPAEAPYALAIALSPDGANLFVIASANRAEGSATRLYAVTFGGSALVTEARPMNLGAATLVQMAGFSAADGRLAVTRSPTSGGSSEVLLVAPNGATQSLLTAPNLLDRAHLSPDGKHLAALSIIGGRPLVSTTTSDVLVVDVAGGGSRKLNASGQVARKLMWADTSDAVAFAVDEGGVVGNLYYGGVAPGAPAATKVDTLFSEFLTEPGLFL